MRPEIARAAVAAQLRVGADAEIMVRGRGIRIRGRCSSLKRFRSPRLLLLLLLLRLLLLLLRLLLHGRSGGRFGRLLVFRGDKVNIVSGGVGITPLPLLLAILAALKATR